MKRFLGFLLFLTLLLSSFPMMSFAETNDKASEQSSAEESLAGEKVFYNNGFTDGFGHASSAQPGSWNGVYGTTCTGTTDPTDPTNGVGSCMLTGSKTITKSYLNAQSTMLVSVSLYIPEPQQGSYPTEVAVALGGFRVLGLTYDGDKQLYAIKMGDTEGYAPYQSWMNLTAILTPSATDGWEKTGVCMQLTGDLETKSGESVSFLKGEKGIAYNDKKCQFSAKVDSDSVAGYYLDNFYVAEIGEFRGATVKVPSYGDGFDNVVLDGEITAKLYHVPDMETFSIENVRLVNEFGEEVPYTELRYDIGKPDRLVFSFAEDPLRAHTQFYIDFGEGVKDVYGSAMKERYYHFETLGVEGQRPIARELILPPEGGFIMPDEYNTGFRCDESELVEFGEKYGVTPRTDVKMYVITEEIAKENNYEFAYFKSDEYGLRVTATSPVYFHDFKLHATGQYGVENNGSQMLFISYATLSGALAAVFNSSRIYLDHLYVYNVPADHLKGTSYQTVVSCYFRNGGYQSPLAHADVNQISMFGAESGITKDMYMVGCRLDVPNIPYECHQSAAIFLAPERVGTYGLANYQLSHNWFNGSAGTVRLGKGLHEEGLFEYVTYAYNRIGYGYGCWAEGIGLNEDELANYGNVMCDSLDVGSIVFYNGEGERVYTLSDMKEAGSVLVNFANYTLQARDYVVFVTLKDADGNAVATFEKDGTIRRYTPYKEYATDDNKQTVTIDGKKYTVLINDPNLPLNVGETLTLSGLPEDMAGYRLEVCVSEKNGENKTILRTSALTDEGKTENEGFDRTYMVTFKDQNGNVLRYAEVYEGHAVPAGAIPNAPDVEGYTFTGWSESLSCITGNTEVQAQYREGAPTTPVLAKHTVIFKDRGGINILKLQTVTHGEAAVPPMTTPEDPGRTFIGWSADYSCITEDMVIVANYKEDQPQIDPAIEAFENAVAALASFENASLTEKYNALYTAALAFAEVVDKQAVMQGEAYQTYIAFAESYNEEARAISGDIVRH